MTKSRGKVRQFTVVIKPEERGYVVHAPALPGCVTQGDTLEEAKSNAAEAAEAYLLGLKDMSQEIPENRDGPLIDSQCLFTINTFKRPLMQTS